MNRTHVIVWPRDNGAYGKNVNDGDGNGDEGSHVAYAAGTSASWLS